MIVMHQLKIYIYIYLKHSKTCWHRLARLLRCRGTASQNRPAAQLQRWKKSNHSKPQLGQLGPVHTGKRCLEVFELQIAILKQQQKSNEINPGNGLERFKSRMRKRPQTLRDMAESHQSWDRSNRSLIIPSAVKAPGIHCPKCSNNA